MIRTNDKFSITLQFPLKSILPWYFSAYYVVIGIWFAVFKMELVFVIDAELEWYNGIYLMSGAARCSHFISFLYFVGSGTPIDAGLPLRAG